MVIFVFHTPNMFHIKKNGHIITRYFAFTVIQTVKSDHSFPGIFNNLIEIQVSHDT